MTLEATLTRVVEAARAEGRDVLLETEGYEVLQAAGLRCPRHALLRTGAWLAAIDLHWFPGDRVVLKAVSPRILHKSDVGAVRVVARHTGAIRDAVEEMVARFQGDDLRGVLIVEFIPHGGGLEGELLAGVRWTDEFGPVLTLGTGGIHTEFLNRALLPHQRVAVLSPLVRTDRAVEQATSAAVVRLFTEPQRGRPARLALPRLERTLHQLLALANTFFVHGIRELEVNPLAVIDDGLVALDALVTLGAPAAVPLPRPISKMRALLEPASAAIVGVSDQMNPGHIILRNLLVNGFDPAHIFVVKPGRDAIDGCRCVAALRDLPQPVDLLVLAVAAPQVPTLIEEALDARAAESLIVIPGGLEEKAGGADLAASARASLARSRDTAWQGPLVVGGNCLGIRSRPGRYDTLFIPDYKLPAPDVPDAPVAIVSQSGAFAIARVSKWSSLSPRYVITTGNQMDATVGDFLTWLKDDPSIDVFGVYVEGFKPLDGLQFLNAASEIAASGRTVVLYRAGRTPAGAAASSSHTASVAGDYVVTEGLCRAAGVLVADTIDDFEDLVATATRLHGKSAVGTRVAALSNAGFECVVMSDALGGLELATFAPDTSARLLDVFRRARIDSLVDVHNPVDLTPIASDGPFVEAVDAILDDPGVDLAVIGCVPLTAALQTLPRGGGHAEDLSAASSLPQRLSALLASSPKPAVVVVDSGPLYDPMARIFERAGVPAFRSADRAVRALDAWARHHRDNRKADNSAHTASERCQSI